MLGITAAILTLTCGQFVQGAPASNQSYSAECCKEKKVGDVTYVLGTEADTTAYGCINDCIYEEKENQGQQFCFQTGDLPVKCMKQQGVKCGIKNQPRIIGGKEAEVNEFPWIAAITDADRTQNCGGTLVASRWVLSAAHCFFKDKAQTQPADVKDMLVALGEHDLSVSGESNITKYIKMESYTIHPQYAGSNMDIAMIKLAEEVDLNVYTPACLANTGDIFTGRNASAYGWGAIAPDASAYPDKLQKIEVPIVSDEQCQAAMIEKGVENEITNDMLCAGGKAGEDSCGGDSGGPLTVDVDGQHVLVGATSFGLSKNCAEAGWYGVYAEVAVLRQWVDETMAMGGQPTPEA